MKNTRDIRTGRHCVFELYVHLVFVPKYRKGVFTEKSLHLMEEYFRKVCVDFETELKEFNGEDDHVHCIIKYPPKYAVAKIVNSLKGASSRKLRNYYPDIKKHFFKDVLWSPSYCAVSCGGAPLEIIKKYIQDQRRPD
jgi:putative transposase